MGVIQSGINQAAQVGAALYTQTPEFKRNQEIADLQGQLKTIHKSYDKAADKFVGEQEITFPDEDAGGEALDKFVAGDEALHKLYDKESEITKPIEDRLAELGDKKILKKRIDEDYRSVMGGLTFNRKKEEIHNDIVEEIERNTGVSKKKAKKAVDEFKNMLAGFMMNNPEIDDAGNLVKKLNLTTDKENKNEQKKR